MCEYDYFQNKKQKPNMLHKMLYDQNKLTAHTCSSYLLLKKPEEDKVHSFARNVRTSRPVQLPFSTTSTIPLYSTGFLSPTQFLVQILLQCFYSPRHDCIHQPHHTQIKNAKHGSPTMKTLHTHRQHGWNGWCCSCGCCSLTQGR